MGDSPEVNLKSIANLKVSRSSTGYRGVIWDRKTQKFQAEVGNNKRGTRKRLGSFDTAEAAARAYDVGAHEMYGCHARLNFPLPGELKADLTRRNSLFCHHGHSVEDHGFTDHKGALGCRVCAIEAANSRLERDAERYARIVLPKQLFDALRDEYEKQKKTLPEFITSSGLE